MVKRLAALFVFLTLIATAPAEGQGVRFGLGLVPVISLETGGGSDFGIGAQVDYIPGGNWGFRLDGAWMFAEFQDYLLWNGDVAYHFRTSSPSIHPFVLGGLAFANSTDFDDSNIGIGAGLGTNFHLRQSPIGLYADARFQHFFDPDFNQLQLGLGARFGTGE